MQNSVAAASFNLAVTCFSVLVITIYATNTVTLQLILKFQIFKVVHRWFLVVSFAVVILIFRTIFMVLLL